MPLLQGEALTLRQMKEPDVEVIPGISPLLIKVKNLCFDSLFPVRGNKPGRGGYDGVSGRGSCGGRGNGRNRGSR